MKENRAYAVFSIILTPVLILGMQVWSSRPLRGAVLHSILPHLARPFVAAGVAGRAHFVHPRTGEQANLRLPSLLLVGEIVNL